MRKFNGLIWWETDADKTILAACLIENDILVDCTQNHVINKTVDDGMAKLQKEYNHIPNKKIWLELRDDAKELNRKNSEHILSGGDEINYK